MMRCLPANGTAGLLRALVSGNKRSPFPPARIMPRMRSLAMALSFVTSGTPAARQQAARVSVLPGRLRHTIVPQVPSRTHVPTTNCRRANRASARRGYSHVQRGFPRCWLAARLTPPATGPVVRQSDEHLPAVDGVLRLVRRVLAKEP